MTEIVKPRTLSFLGRQHARMRVDMHASRKMFMLCGHTTQDMHIMLKKLALSADMQAYSLHTWLSICFAFQQVHRCRIVLNIGPKLPEPVTNTKLYMLPHDRQGPSEIE